MNLYTIYSPSHEVFYKEYFLKTIPNEFNIITKKIPQECPSGTFYQSGWSETCFQKVKFFLKACEENFNGVFVFSDVDVQFFGGIKNTLLEELGDFDIACQNDTGSVHCSGFFVCKCNDKTLNMFKAMVDNYDTEDQKTLNQNIHLCKSKFLSLKFLTVANLTHRIWEPSQIDIYIPSFVLMHHANFTSGIENKIKLLNFVKGKLLNENI